MAPPGIQELSRREARETRNKLSRRKLVEGDLLDTFSRFDGQRHLPFRISQYTQYIKKLGVNASHWSFRKIPTGRSELPNIRKLCLVAIFGQSSLRTGQCENSHA